MKKTLFSLIALSTLSLVSSTYAATSGAQESPLRDPNVVTVTTQTSLTSETPITDVSVSNVVKQDDVVVSDSTTSVPVEATSVPVVEPTQVPDTQAVELMARTTSEEIPAEMEGLLGFMFILPILMFILGIGFSIFWLWMLIDAIKHETEQKALWIIVLFVTNGIGAILYYFMAKKPRDKANKPVETVSQVAPVSPEPVVAPVTPEVVVVNPAPTVAPEVVVVNPEPVVAPVEAPAVDSSAPVADQSSTPSVS